MQINSATTAFTLPAITPQVQTGRDADGDNDGSKAGEVEKAATVQKLAASGTVGTLINTTA